MSRGRSAGLALALLADALLGDPARGHPVALFGALAGRVEARVYAPRRTAGAIFSALLVLPPTLAAWQLDRRLPRGLRSILLAVVGWAALGGRSLRRAAERMTGHLEAGELEAARGLAPTLFGRDPESLDGAGLARATVESLAENTSDAVAGTLFWGALAGPAGVVLHRCANTLDAMVGYRSERYLRFGWCAARLDDLLGLPAARLTAAAVVAGAALGAGDARGAAAAWRRDARRHPSPNAGHAEAAFAGALGVTLGGSNRYGDRVEHRPLMGSGPAPDVSTLRRALRLSRATAGVLAVVAVAAAWR